MSKIKLLALFGESSAGKDSIQRWLCQEQNMHKIISHTTRPPRDYEQEGEDYYFLPTADEFFKLFLGNKFLEISGFNGWYYGTSIDSLVSDKINVGVFNPQGVRSILKYKEELDILPVWIQANDKTRLLRSINREKAPDCYEICRRFLVDKEDFSNIDFDYEVYLNEQNHEEYYGFLKRPKVVNFINGLN